MLFLLFGPAIIFGANYYIDPAGNDKNNGLSPSAAWKTLAKLNSVEFQKSDSILFAAGGIWTGQLKPKGSGVKGRPIVVDTYGSGNLPIINGNGLLGEAVIYLYRLSYWEINNLEITNKASSGGDRRGIQVVGPYTHVHLKGLKIHDVKGIVGQSYEAKGTGAIAFTGSGNDILVDNCTIYSIDNTGIYTAGSKFQNVRFSNNTISDIAKNAIILRRCDSTCVVERNIVFNTALRAGTGNMIFSAGCDGSIFQFNEGYLNKATGNYDGSLYDLDIDGGSNTKWQYSYSHDNNYGFMWFPSEATDTGVVVRYNVSQNDKKRILAFARHLGSATFYNNVFYIGPNVNPDIIWQSSNYTQNTNFYNNIIYNLSSGASYKFSPTSKNTFEYNVFYGKHPSNEPKDPFKLTSDPQFVNPGSGKNGINTLGGYALKKTSPAINSGKVIKNHGGRDFFGNPLYNGKPDRGIFEFPKDTVATAPIDTVPTAITSNHEYNSKSLRGINNSRYLKWLQQGADIPTNQPVRLYDGRGIYRGTIERNSSNIIRLNGHSANSGFLYSEPFPEKASAKK